MNQQLRADLGIKAQDGSESVDLIEQITQASEQLSKLEKEYKTCCIQFDAQEEELALVEKTKCAEVTELDAQRQQQTQKVEEQLKSLRHELQSLKIRDKTDETVEIDVDSVATENEELRTRISELDQKIATLTQWVTDNQTDCVYLGQWLKKEQGTHTDPDTIFKELIQKQCQAREELDKLKNSV